MFTNAWNTFRKGQPELLKILMTVINLTALPCPTNKYDTSKNALVVLVFVTYKQKAHCLTHPLSTNLRTHENHLRHTVFANKRCWLAIRQPWNKSVETCSQTQLWKGALFRASMASSLTLPIIYTWRQAYVCTIGVGFRCTKFESFPCLLHPCTSTDEENTVSV